VLVKIGRIYSAPPTGSDFLLLARLIVIVDSLILPLLVLKNLGVTVTSVAKVQTQVIGVSSGTFLR
jgi:hypothetical protein